MPAEGYAELKIYDMTGRLTASLVEAELKEGSYTISFDASSYSSGIYIYRLTAGTFTDSKKMVLVK